MRYLFALGCSLLAFVPAAAEGLLYRLPDDGAFIRYDLEFEISYKKLNEEKQTAKGSLTLSSVGQATVDKEKCRWIELHGKMTQDGREESFFAKVLIPEKRLKAGEKPLDHVIKGWLRDSEAEPQAWAALGREKKVGLEIFLAGPLNDVKKLPKETVDSKLGKLDCEGVRGVTTIDGPRGAKMRVSYECRLHDKAPFGVVSCRMNFVMLGDDGTVQGVVIGNLRALEAGKNAKSELPDLK